MENSTADNTSFQEEALRRLFKRSVAMVHRSGTDDFIVIEFASTRDCNAAGELTTKFCKETPTWSSKIPEGGTLCQAKPYGIQYSGEHAKLLLGKFRGDFHGVFEVDWRNLENNFPPVVEHDPTDGSVNWDKYLAWLETPEAPERMPRRHANYLAHKQAEAALEALKVSLKESRSGGI